MTIYSLRMFQGAGQWMRQPGRNMVCASPPESTGPSFAIETRAIIRIQVLRLSWVACQIYRSCRKATLWFGAPARCSASLPIVHQRASCFVRPCIVNVRIAFSLSKRTLTCHKSHIGPRIPQIFHHFFGASTIYCSTSCQHLFGTRRKVRL